MDQLEAEFCRLQLQMDKEYMLECSKQQCTQSREYYGVHPGELAHRLHELLEERQQEGIKELESALECAMHKLHEKERELSWRKDTETFLSPFQSLACRSRQKTPSQILKS
ncbi:protein POLAR DURING ASYMMETRIC DIVISION AND REDISTRIBUTION-like [Forsythia ovata]|uniref:Protein POLAR DURING ASYMMETRIC DIVISION AND REDISTRIBUTION-like n=1 Tax=Forsythia ovata TaxID=205694 RepID=A0ABD1W4V9_9LAMI